MNKRDIVLIILVVTFIISISVFNNGSKGSIALVYKDNIVIMEIDLKTDSEYTIDGELGPVILEVKDQKIRVANETSPNNICSKQGFIENSNQSLICLPNKIVIKLKEESNIDAVVR